MVRPAKREAIVKDVLIKSMLALLLLANTAFAADALPSWNDTGSKKGSADFVPPAERIATFDSDGTLWAEQPMYFQLLFALDQRHREKPIIETECTP